MQNLESYLFFDIETAPVEASYQELPPAMQPHWDRKNSYLKTADGQVEDPAVSFSNRAGVYAEFAKVVCISLGSFQRTGGHWQFRVKSITSHDEPEILQSFVDIVIHFAALHHGIFQLVGHNIREFDLPFISRRLLVNNMPIPELLNVQGKKPWEVKFIEDTLELWKFGDYKQYTSLALMATLFGIPSPKDDIDGSMVGRVYWEEKDLRRISTYCAKDVVTTAKVYLRLKGIKDVEVVPFFVDEE